MRKAERMDKAGSPDVAERCQETPGHLPCPRKPLRAPPASLQWVFAHPGLSQLHQPHFLPLGPRSHPMTTSIPHHTHPSHTATQPSAGGCQGSQFLPPPQLPALGRGWHRQEPHGDKLPGGCPRPGAFGCTHPTGSSSLPSPASRVLTENPLLPLQPLPVRGSAGANARHGAASANIDRAGKATSARSCSLLRANGKEPPLGEQRCSGRSVPAQGGTHAGVRPGEAIPAHPGACHGSVICPTQPCSCSRLPPDWDQGLDPWEQQEGGGCSV